MKRIIAAAVVALALIATAVVGAAPATADNSTRPVQTTEFQHVHKVQLLATSDFQVACLTMDRDGRYTVEKIDYVFRVKVAKGDAWHNAWVAPDGFQFVIEPLWRQNQPWACTPLPARVPVPAAWANN